MVITRRRASGWVSRLPTNRRAPSTPPSAMIRRACSSAIGAVSTWCTPPKFAGAGAEVADPVRQRMRDLYEGREVPRYLDQAAQGATRRRPRHLRANAPYRYPDRRLGTGHAGVPVPRGDRIMNTLAVLLTGHDLDVGHDALALTVRGTTAHGLWRLLADLAVQPPPNPVDLAAAVQNATVDKRDHHLSPQLLQRSYAARALDVAGAWEALGQLTDSAPPTACSTGINPTPAHRPSELASVELGRTPFAVVDVATTGLYPQDRDRIVEIAIVHTAPNGTIQDVWSTLLEPERDPGPTRLHGLTPGDLVGAPRFAEVAVEIADRPAGRVVVAHGSDFDLGFLVAELTRAGLTPPLWPVLCSRSAAPRGNIADGRLDRACAAENIELTNRFEPVPAATATAQLLARLLNKAATPDLGLDDIGCQPLDLPLAPPLERPTNVVPARPRPPRVDVVQTTAAMRSSHAHGKAGFAARTRSGPTGTAADDAALPGIVEVRLTEPSRAERGRLLNVKRRSRRTGRRRRPAHASVRRTSPCGQRPRPHHRGSTSAHSRVHSAALRTASRSAHPQPQAHEHRPADDHNPRRRGDTQHERVQAIGRRGDDPAVAVHPHAHDRSRRRLADHGHEDVVLLHRPRRDSGPDATTPTRDPYGIVPSLTSTAPTGVRSC